MQSKPPTGPSSLPGIRGRFDRFSRFSKKDRVVQRSEFVSMRDGSTKLYSKHLLILVKPNKHDRSRLGVTITKKVDKRAVARNRFKRMIRELFRLNRFKLQQNFDIVVIARFGAHECSLNQLSKEFLGALNKKGFLVKKSAPKPNSGE